MIFYKTNTGNKALKITIKRDSFIEDYSCGYKQMLQMWS